MCRTVSDSPHPSMPTRWVLLCLGVCVLLSPGISPVYDLDGGTDADEPDDVLWSARVPSIGVPVYLLGKLEAARLKAPASSRSPTPRPPTL